MFDQNQDGEIDIAEFSKLLLYIKQWKTSFTHFDKDCNGVIDAEELHETLKVILTNLLLPPAITLLISTNNQTHITQTFNSLTAYLLLF